jgi:hypothetical protein
LLGSNNSLDTAPTLKSQAQCEFTMVNRASIAATKATLIRELLTEAITIAVGFGLNCLRAAQYGDDEAAIGEFRGFHAAAHTATECIRELRGLVEWAGR